MSGLSTELEAALSAMEASFHVRLIGTFDKDLVWAPADVQAARWLAENHPEFDQFPVKDGDKTVGVLVRNGDYGSKFVFEAMQGLREGLIVSADMPIRNLILHLIDNHFRLVLRGGRIDGLVTQSDLLKLPVRMLLFGLISHLELCLRALIRERMPAQEWMEALQPERRKALKSDLKRLSKARLEPDLLEFTNLSDVVDALSGQPELGVNFKAEMDSIRRLRNDLAHAKTYISSPADVRQFADRFKTIQYWIDSISALVKGPSRLTEPFWPIRGKLPSGISVQEGDNL